MQAMNALILRQAQENIGGYKRHSSTDEKQIQIVLAVSVSGLLLMDRKVKETRMGRITTDGERLLESAEVRKLASKQNESTESFVAM